MGERASAAPSQSPIQAWALVLYPPRPIPSWEACSQPCSVPRELWADRTGFPSLRPWGG